MTQNLGQSRQGSSAHRSRWTGVPLFFYFACLPLFFSASALSWPFPESLETAPPSVRDWPGARDCQVVPSQSEAPDEQGAVEDEEPDCE